MFQFQNGAIISLFVALRLTTTLWFQFQNGAIISWRPFTINDVFIKFQFQNGAIIRLIYLIWLKVNYKVSIPKWCDYKKRAITMYLQM